MFVLLVSTAWVLTCAIWNILEPRVPNWLTSLGLFLALLFRWYDWLPTGMIQNQLVIILIVWVMVFILWRIRWIGGGDAKFVVAAVLAFPDWLLVACLMIADIIGMLIFSIRRDGFSWEKMRNRITGNLEELPEAQDRLRATTFLGLGWLVWMVISLLY
jgi:Flp pilus assembly protein protease CpaA